jgi:predicted metal-dependent hydrolase
MKNQLIILLLSFISGPIKSQTYTTAEVIEKSQSHLKRAVGEKLFKYFKLDPNSYYEYRTKAGKIKWGNISKGKKTKGKFINGKNIRFNLNHPEFPYPYVYNGISVPLTSELELKSEIILDRVPISL